MLKNSLVWPKNVMIWASHCPLGNENSYLRTDVATHPRSELIFHENNFLLTLFRVLEGRTGNFSGISTFLRERRYHKKKYDWANATTKLIWTGSSVRSKCSSVLSVPSVLSVLSVELIFALFAQQQNSFEPVQVFKCSSFQPVQNESFVEFWIWFGRLPKTWIWPISTTHGNDYGLVGYPNIRTWLLYGHHPLGIKNMKIQENSEKFRGPPGGL